MPAVELSSIDPLGEDLHILGYGIDPADPGLAERLEAYRADRRGRDRADGRRAGGARLAARPRPCSATSSPPGRPHLAAAAFHHPGNAARVAAEGLANPSDAARRLSHPRPARPTGPRTIPTVADAIAAIHDAGGVAVWAHPFWDVDAEREVEAALRRFAAGGMDGVEAFYIEHDARADGAAVRPRRGARPAHDGLRGLPRAQSTRTSRASALRALRARTAPRSDRRRVRLSRVATRLTTHGRLRAAPALGDDALVDARPGAIAAVSALFGRDVGAALAAHRGHGARRARRGCAAHRVPRVGAGRVPPRIGARGTGGPGHDPARAGPRRTRDRAPLARSRATSSSASGTARRARRASATRRPSASRATASSGRHRKVHLPPAERFAYAAGDGFAAFDTPVGRDRDAALLRQALPRGVARAGARRRAGHRVHVGLVGGPAQAGIRAARRPPDAPLRRRRLLSGPSRTRSSGSRRTSPDGGARDASSAARRSSIPTAWCSRRRGTARGSRSRTVDPAARDRGDAARHRPPRRPPSGRLRRAAYPSVCARRIASASSSSSSDGLSSKAERASSTCACAARRRCALRPAASSAIASARSAVGDELRRAVGDAREVAEPQARRARAPRRGPPSARGGGRACRARRSRARCAVRSFFGTSSASAAPAASTSPSARSPRARACASTSVHGRGDEVPAAPRRARTPPRRRAAPVPRPARARSRGRASPSASRAQACAWSRRHALAAEALRELVGAGRVEADRLAAAGDRRQHVPGPRRSAAGGARRTRAPPAS